MYPAIPGSPGPSALTGPPSRDALGPRCPQQPPGTGGLEPRLLDAQAPSALCAPSTSTPLPKKGEQPGNRALLMAAPPCVQLTKRSLTLPKVPPGNGCTHFSGQGVLVDGPQRPSYSTKENRRDRYKKDSTDQPSDLQGQFRKDRNRSSIACLTLLPNSSFRARRLLYVFMFTPHRLPDSQQVFVR